MSRIIYTLTFLLIALKLTGQAELGQKAPQITANKWINGKSQESLITTNKAIVLDFWFTNCAPCVYTIPHLNDLSKQYKADDVIFISISFEDEDQILKFLSKKKIYAMVGSDTSYQTIKRYNVDSYPTTFLIDSDGILRWRGHPTHLTSQMIDVLLSKQSYPSLIRSEDNIMLSTQSQDQGVNNLYPIKVSKNDYMNGASGMQFNSSEVSIANQSLDYILSYLLQTSKSRISINDENRYDVYFKIPSTLPKNIIKTEILKSLLNNLDCQMNIEKKEVEGYEIELTIDSLFIQNAIDTSRVYYNMAASVNQTFWQGSGVQIPDLIKELENRFGVFIKNRTNINGYFTFSFPLESFNGARGYLLKNYGLSLVSRKMELDIVEIVKRNKD